MIKTVFFLTAIVLVQARPNEDDVVTNVGSYDETFEAQNLLAVEPVVSVSDADDCETLDNGCPTNFTIHKLLPHEEYCHLFYYCDKGELVLKSCPEPLYFDPKKEVCVWSSDTECVNDGPYTYPTTVESEVENSTDAVINDIGQVLDNGCPTDIHIHHLLPHEECEKFYQCNFGQKVERNCAPGTVFHFEIQVCDWPYNVPRCSGSAGNVITTARPTSTPGETSDEIQLPNDPNEEWEFLPNGCPTNSSITHLLPHESECEKFYYCDNGALVEFDCPSGTHFSPSKQICTWPHEAGCEHWTGGNGCSNPGDNEGSCGGSTAESITSTTPVADTSTTPVADNSTTPVADNSTTPVADSSTTPVADNSTTPIADNSTTPVADNSTTPVADNSTTPVADNSTTPVSDNATTPIADNSTTTPVTPEVSTTTTTTTTTETPPSDIEDSITEDPIDSITTPDESTDSCEDLHVPSDPELPATATPPCPQCPTGPVDPADRCKAGCNVAPWAHAECDKFYTCVGDEARLNICSEGLHYNPRTLTCDFICNAGCVRNVPQVTRHADGTLVFVPHSFGNVASMMQLIEHELNEEL